MIMENPFSEPGTLLMLGAVLVAVSFVLRRLLKVAVQAFKPTAKVEIRTHESAIK